MPLPVDAKRLDAPQHAVRVAVGGYIRHLERICGEQADGADAAIGGEDADAGSVQLPGEKVIRLHEELTLSVVLVDDRGFARVSLGQELTGGGPSGDGDGHGGIIRSALAENDVECGGFGPLAGEFPEETSVTWRGQ